jgi:hypothetical protein
LVQESFFPLSPSLTFKTELPINTVKLPVSQSTHSGVGVANSGSDPELAPGPDGSPRNKTVTLRDRVRATILEHCGEPNLERERVEW